MIEIEGIRSAIRIMIGEKKSITMIYTSFYMIGKFIRKATTIDLKSYKKENVLSRIFIAVEESYKKLREMNSDIL